MAIRPRGRKRSLSKKVSSFNMWMDQVYQVRDHGSDQSRFETGEGATDLSDVEEVAELLKVKPRTIYAWVSDRRIPFERKGGLLRFRLDAVIAWNQPTR